MTGLAFFRKEIKEILRTSKIYVLPAIFLFFGLSSPLLAKLMPELLKMAGETSEFTIIMKINPSALDSLQQFLKNAATGLLAIILVYMGTVLDEKTRGTSILVLTKPLKRTTFIWVKFWAAALLTSFAILLGTVACVYYNMILWPEQPQIGLTVQSGLIILVYGLFLTALTICASTLASNTMVAAGGAIGAYIIFSILPSFGKLWVKYTPGGLLTQAGKMIVPVSPLAFSETLVTMTITLFATLGLVWVSGLLFKRQEL